MTGAPDDCPVCGSPIPRSSVACVRCGWAVSEPSAPHPPPLDFTHPPTRPLASDEADEENAEVGRGGSDEEEIDGDDIDDDDEGFWTWPRVVRLVFVLIAVIVILLVVARGG